MTGIWAFLNDPNNREMLAWIGGVVVTLMGGLWAVFKYWRDHARERQVSLDEQPKNSTLHVTAVGGVASGGNLSVRDITISGRSRVARGEPDRSSPNAGSGTIHGRNEAG